MNLRACAAAALSTLLLTGCGATTSAGSPATSSPTGTTAAALKAPCTAADEPPQDGPQTDYDGRLTKDFEPVAAFLCFDEHRRFPGDGEWQVLVGQRLLGDLQPLRRALLKPDTPQPFVSAGVTYACAGSLVIRPTLILVTASGRQLRPRPPVDYCHDQLAAVDAAMSPLRHVSVQALKLRQLQTQARLDLTAKALQVGCQPAWKDPFSHGMVPSGLSAGGAFVALPGTATACLYAASASQPLEVDFVAGRRLTAQQTRALLDAADLPGRRGGCAKPHTGLLLVTKGQVLIAQIEVGGCSRVIRQLGSTDVVGRVRSAAVASLTPR
jgi:hypothetical protein